MHRLRGGSHVTAFLVVGVFAGAFVSAASDTDHPIRSRVAKTIASTLVIVLLLVAVDSWTAYAALVLVALVASWIGDLALTFDRSRAFLVGLVSFAAAHVVYTAAFGVRGISLAWFLAGAIAMAVFGSLVLGWLEPHRPPQLRVPVRVYVGLIALMVAAAVGTAANEFDLRIPLAAFAFAASDVLVARQRFVEPSSWNRLIGLPLYYLAQVLFAFTAV